MSSTVAEQVQARSQSQGWVADPRPFGDEGFVSNGALPDAAWRDQVLFKQMMRPRLDPLPLPSSFDHREKGWTFPAQDQGATQACVAHAACAALEVRLMRGGSRLPARAAPRYLHFCLMNRAAEVGANYSLLDRALGSNGMPLSQGRDEALSDRSACAAGTRPQTVAVGAVYVLRTADDVKRDIVRHGPVVAHMHLHRDLWDWYRAGIYRAGDAEPQGTHAVSVIGYDDAGAYWICQNSRGPRWGEDGCFRIAYGECGIAMGLLPAYAFG